MELNGQPATLADIKTLALLSYGHFTTLRVHQAQVHGLGIHLERLERDSQRLFGQSVDGKKVREYVRGITVDQSEDAWVRVTVFSRQLDLGEPEKDCELDVLVNVRPVPKNHNLPPMKVKPIRFQRDMPDVKSVSLGPSLYRRRQARQEGFDDALFMNDQNEISEGTTWNIAFVKDQQIILPSTPSLAGVSVALLTRALTLQSHHPLIQAITTDDIKHMDAAFALNSTYGPRPIARIGQHTFADNPQLTSYMEQLYQSVPYEQL